MYKITQIIHLTNIEKYILVTRENASLLYTRLSNQYKSWKPGKECWVPTGQESDGHLQERIAVSISLQVGVLGQPLLQDPKEGSTTEHPKEGGGVSACVARPPPCEPVLQTEGRGRAWTANILTLCWLIEMCNIGVLLDACNYKVWSSCASGTHWERT